MKKVANYIIALILMTSLLPATSGVGIYHHVCSDTGEHTTGLYHKAECKSHHHHKKDNSTQHSCCTNDNTIEHYNLDENCCYEFSEYKTIEADLFKIQSSENSIKLFVVNTLKVKDIIDNKKLTVNFIENDNKKITVHQIIKFIHYQSKHEDSEDSFC